VAYLEPFMEKSDTATKGRIVLATVRGDVHDIGKNLVDIILSNNGYTTFNIGIKQPIADIIKKAEDVNADAIGLSGLLVKSTVVMRDDLQELNSRELWRYPVLLGGAALTRKYVEQDLRNIYRGRVYYCQDAFEGLATMDAVMGLAEAPTATQARPPAEDTGYDEVRVTTPPVGTAVETGPSDRDYAVSEVRSAPTPAIPQPPFWGSRTVKGLPLRDIFPYVNEIALFRGQWQYQKKGMSDADYEAQLDNEVRPAFRALQEQAIRENLLVPQVVYGYFPCLAEKNDLLAWPGFDASGNPAGEPVRFRFPRQPSGRRLCIADYFLDGNDPERPAPYDVLGLSLVTMGPVATSHAQELFKAGQYVDYLRFHGFAVESAEGLAEMWHRRMRHELGIDGRDAPTIRGLFQQGYQGSRYAFGYPACPDLEEQTGIAELLDPSRIGVELSETFQWHPEQSTAAVVVHHPAARYFVIR
jgi:5-methyltetrahydrofolate--homocysteine methyltransferase